MRIIGGELELQHCSENIYFTDTGRSSLRLFIRSVNKDKRYLIPNFFCKIIEDILQSENVTYSFYNILPNLSIDLDSFKDNEFDVFYIINYFGQFHDLNNINLSNKIVIEDNVFVSEFSNHKNFAQWFGFNSFRKISNLACGSMIKTNLLINQENIIREDAPFSKIKYDAKNIKYDFLHNVCTCYSESDYLSKFDDAETLLNHQEKIYSISNTSLSLLYKHSDQELRKQRFITLFKLFPDNCLNINTTEFSYFVLSIAKRDELRNKLKDNKIFLPIHWPESTQPNNLYNNVISIPLFETYNDIEFNYLIEKLKELI